MTSRADQHDLDKLGRWHQDLTATSHSTFPAYAIFLVSADDRVSHDIFRKFRASFEARNAGFANLVIFGQHGVSTTVRSLLPEFGLPQEAIPTLALLTLRDPTCVYSLPLPPGDSKTSNMEQLDALWQTALEKVEGVADEGTGLLELASIDGLSCHHMAESSLEALVSKLLANLS